MAKKKSKGTNMKLLIGVGAVLLLVVVASFFMFSGSSSYVREDVDALAQCLTEKGIPMYGTFWCPKCAEVKKHFGSSFQYVTYIECDARGENEQSELCIEKGIDKYATFEFPDGSRLIGKPSLEEIAEKAECPVPRKAE